MIRLLNALFLMCITFAKTFGATEDDPRGPFLPRAPQVRIPLGVPLPVENPEEDDDGDVITPLAAPAPAPTHTPPPPVPVRAARGGDLPGDVGVNDLEEIMRALGHEGVAENIFRSQSERERELKRLAATQQAEAKGLSRFLPGALLAGFGVVAGAVLTKALSRS